MEGFTLGDRVKWFSGKRSFTEKLQFFTLLVGVTFSAYTLNGCAETSAEEAGVASAELKNKKDKDTLAAIAELKAEIKDLRGLIKDLRKAIHRTKRGDKRENIRTEIRALKAEIHALRARIKALRNGEVVPGDDEEEPSDNEPPPEPPVAPVVEDVPAVALPGEAFSLTFSAPVDHSTSDWVGLFPVGAEIEDYYDWAYVPSGGTGSITLTLPPDATGAWEIRYFSFNGVTSTVTATSLPIVVQ